MELNPNHQVTRTVSEHWHKVAALLMKKAGMEHVVITEADIAALENLNQAIVIDARADGLHVSLVDMATAEKLARQEGGLPT
jgi:Cu/Ag efflux pump CusA